MRHFISIVILPLRPWSATVEAQTATRAVAFSLDDSTDVPILGAKGWNGSLAPAETRNTVDFGSLLSVDGVELSCLRAEVQHGFEIELVFSGLDQDPFDVLVIQTFREFFFGGSDDATSWAGGDGVLDFASTVETGIVPGESRQVRLAQSFSHSVTLDSSFGYIWDFVYADPVLQTSLSLPAAGTWANFSHPSNPIRLEGGSVSTNTSGVLELDFELAPIDLTSTCLSQPNSTGARGLVEAYGTTQQGTEFLNIREVGLPGDAPSILFVGTQAGGFPASTYTVCVGGSIVRQGGVQIATSGTAEFEIDLIGRSVGESVHFQVLHRDPVLGVAATGGSAFIVSL